jgi:uncharacterized membrane protein
MSNLDEKVREWITPGSPQGAVLYGVLGIILAFMFIFLGIWKTLFTIAFFILGLFWGGVKEKGEFFKHIVNKLFPPQGKQ